MAAMTVIVVERKHEKCRVAAFHCVDAVVSGGTVVSACSMMDEPLHN